MNRTQQLLVFARKNFIELLKTKTIKFWAPIFLFIGLAMQIIIGILVQELSKTSMLPLYYLLPIGVALIFITILVIKFFSTKFKEDNENGILAIERIKGVATSSSFIVRLLSINTIAIVYIFLTMILYLIPSIFLLKPYSYEIINIFTLNFFFLFIILAIENFLMLIFLQFKLYKVAISLVNVFAVLILLSPILSSMIMIFPAFNDGHMATDTDNQAKLYLRSELDKISKKHQNGLVVNLQKDIYTLNEIVQGDSRSNEHDEFLYNIIEEGVLLDIVELNDAMFESQNEQKKIEINRKSLEENWIHSFLNFIHGKSEVDSFYKPEMYKNTYFDSTGDKSGNEGKNDIVWFMNALEDIDYSSFNTENKIDITSEEISEINDLLYTTITKFYSFSRNSISTLFENSGLRYWGNNTSSYQDYGKSLDYSENPDIYKEGITVIPAERLWTRALLKSINDTI